MVVDLDREFFKETVVNEFEQDEDDLSELLIRSVCTARQLEIFHKTLFTDLYHANIELSFEAKDYQEKRYFIVPLKLKQQDRASPSASNACGRGSLTYEVDRNLLQKTERLFLHGYKSEQQNIIDWLDKKGLRTSSDTESLNSLLREWMMVKEDKPNKCYHFDMLLQNLAQMPVEDFVLAIRGEPVELNCAYATELIWKVPTRFKSVAGFREIEEEKFKDDPQGL